MKLLNRPSNLTIVFLLMCILHSAWYVWEIFTVKPPGVLLDGYRLGYYRVSTRNLQYAFLRKDSGTIILLKFFSSYFIKSLMYFKNIIDLAVNYLLQRSKIIFHYFPTLESSPPNIFSIPPGSIFLSLFKGI